MSGNKTIQNNSDIAISVVLRGRNGADPDGGSLPPVSTQIAPHDSATLQYGTDQNPYLNSLDVEETSNGSDIRQSFAATQRGGVGTLDNLLNANSTVVVGYDSESYSFMLSAHN